MNNEVDPFLIISKKNSNRLDGKFRLSWTEDCFDVHGTSQKTDVLDSGTSHIGSSFTTKKVFFILIVIALSISVVVGRLMYLQILQGDTFRNLAEGNRQRIIPIPSERGLVFDRNDVQITQNIPNFSLAVIPQDLPKKNEELVKVIVELADIVNKNVEEIAEIIHKYSNYQRDSIIIQEDIPYEMALKIQIATADLPGIYVQRGSKRLYTPQGIVTSTIPVVEESLTVHNDNSLSHILGYVGKLSPEEVKENYNKGYLPSDSIGKTGVEKTYEQYLRGIYGRRTIEVNSRGKEQSVLAEESPNSGSHIKLNIDINIQAKLEEILQNTLDKIQKKRASAVAMNPQNGEILALVSLPGFDNNDFSGGIDAGAYTRYIEDENKPLFNRAIAGAYPSGSVIKPSIASAALEEKIITPYTTVNSVGGINVGQWFFPDWKAGGHGTTDVRKSIAWSVNTFYYTIGGGYGNIPGLGVTKMTEYFKKYGLGSELGIDIPGEAEGFVPSPEWKEKVKKEPWYIGDTYNLSIGQGDLLVTPLQITAITSAISNGGILYEPHVVHSIIDPITKEETIADSKILNENFIHKENLETIKLGMKDCVEEGSCWDLNRLPFRSGGKTGTAQWSSTKDTHAWFTAFAPFEKPEIAITIMVEEGGEGGWVSEPAGANFLQWWATYRYKN